MICRGGINKYEFPRDGRDFEREDDLEILEESPMKVNVSMAALDKGKGTSIVPVKRKAGSNVAGPEKLMTDALRTRSTKRLAKIEIIERKEMGKRVGSGISVGTSRAFGPNCSLKEETILLTPYERAKWVKQALPPGAKNTFKILQSQEVKGRMDSAMIEV